MSKLIGPLSLRAFVPALLLMQAALAVDYPRAKESCVASTDCFDEFEYCEKDQTEAEGVCEHKDVTPVLAIEVLGYFMTFLILLTSNMGGLGGGGAVIPIAMVFFGFDTKQSIALSNATIVVASLARYLFNFNKPHPYKGTHGVLVDYNVASLMLPMITIGATVGQMLNKILPSVVIAIMLTLLLVFVSYTTLKKLCRIVSAERKKYGPVYGKNED